MAGQRVKKVGLRLERCSGEISRENIDLRQRFSGRSVTALPGSISYPSLPERPLLHKCKENGHQNQYMNG